MGRYWIFVNNQPDGPYEVEALIALPGFKAHTMICLEGECNWRPAKEVPEVCQALGIPAPLNSSKTLRAHVAWTPRYAVGERLRIISSGDILGPDYQMKDYRSSTNYRVLRSRPGGAVVDWVARPRPRVRYFRTMIAASVFLLLDPDWPHIRAQLIRLRKALTELVEQK